MPVSSPEALKSLVGRTMVYTLLSSHSQTPSIHIHHRTLCVGVNVYHPYLVVRGQLGKSALKLFLCVPESERSDALNSHSLQLEIDTEVKAVLIKAVLTESHTLSRKLSSHYFRQH